MAGNVAIGAGVSLAHNGRMIDYNQYICSVLGVSFLRQRCGGGIGMLGVPALMCVLTFSPEVWGVERGMARCDNMYRLPIS
jgi:hypothetical protein